MEKYQRKIFAHRGASRCAPENSMEAFLLAYDKGVDGIEFDVQLTKDNQMVVAHDEWLERVSGGTGFIRDYTLRELRTLNFNKTMPEYRNVKISTVQDVFDEFVDKNILLNIELKNLIYPYQGLEEMILECAKSYKLLDNIIFSSFSHKSMVRLKCIEQNAQVAFLCVDGIIDIHKYMLEYGVCIANPVWYLCDKEMIKTAHENHQEINVWAVDSGTQIHEFCDWGIDGIITNRPELGVEIKNDYRKENTAYESYNKKKAL